MGARGLCVNLLILRNLHRQMKSILSAPIVGAAAFVIVSLPGTAFAQEGIATRVRRLLETRPYQQMVWGIVVADETGDVLYELNADRAFVPASNAKLVVSAAATALLPHDFRIATSVYGSGPLVDGVLDGDLVIYGRGDPTFSERCYGVDTLAAGACETKWTKIETLADQLWRNGLRHVTGSIVGDGSYFDGQLVHPSWESYDLNWWYAAPISALGFNDNSVDVTWGPGARIDAPAAIAFEPDLSMFLFENRTRTVPASGQRTIDFFREPGRMMVWAEGTVPIGNAGKTEYFALPDPNRYLAHALRNVLEKRGISIAGGTESTTDPARYRCCRNSPAIAEIQSRPLRDIVFPILNSSQNWFAEMLLKRLGREFGGEGSWDAGLEVERRFLVDSVGIDPGAFALRDGSGLSSGNLMSPRAFVKLLQYVYDHPNRAVFLDALPRSRERGSLRDRFVGTPLEGRVIAKTGSIARVQTLSGYIEQPNERVLIFSIMANNAATPYNALLRQIDTLVTAFVN